MNDHRYTKKTKNLMIYLLLSVMMFVIVISIVGYKTRVDPAHMESADDERKVLIKDGETLTPDEDIRSVTSINMHAQEIDVTDISDYEDIYPAPQAVTRARIFWTITASVIVVILTIIVRIFVKNLMS